MRYVIAVLLSVTLIAGSAAAEDDQLLDFDWMTDTQRAEAKEAHEALEAAERALCSVMVDIYTQHAARVHDGEALGAEEVRFMKHRCAIQAFADHVAQSLALHDRIHAETHSGHDD